MTVKKINAVLTRGREMFAEAVYPPDIYCIGCGRPVDPGGLYSLCDDCISDIKWANGKVCRFCGKNLEDWYPDDVCSECKGSDRSFSGGVTCFTYRTVVRKIIKKLKYGGEGHLGRILGEILADSARARGYEPDLVIPVPMFPAKERMRGYNQAGVIAEYTAEYLQTEFCADVLVRTRSTRPMSRLNRKERRMNLEGAFELSEKGRSLIPGRRVMVVDDIFTTGTTLDCCGEILIKAGAAEVFAGSAAAGFNQRDIPDSDRFLRGGRKN